jgi:hypothetical protein
MIRDAVINDGPGLCSSSKNSTGYTLEVTNGVEDAVDEMRPGLPGS